MWQYNYSRYDELYHHGIKGQKWGIKNGPPYPLVEKAKTVTKDTTKKVKATADKYTNRIKVMNKMKSVNKVMKNSYTYIQQSRQLLNAGKTVAQMLGVAGAASTIAGVVTPLGTAASVMSGAMVVGQLAVTAMDPSTVEAGKTSSIV